MEPSTPPAVRPGLLIILIVIVLAGAGYFAWYFIGQNQAVPMPVDTFTPVARITTATQTISPSPSPSVSISPSVSPSPSATTSVNWKNYKNSVYGFSFTFPGDQWKDYKAFEVIPEDKSAAKYIYFAVPTTDKTWKESNVGAGYASAMAVAVYTKAQWDQVKNEPNIGAPAGQNDMYVFTVTQAQAAPTDLINTKFGISSIDSSFKAQ